MNSFNFKSQPCTSREQSEKLLALGLKKETRDVVLKKYIHNDKYCYKPIFEDIDDHLIDCDDLYPAWSLGRLIEMYVERYISCSMNLKDLTIEWIINEIEIHIKEGDFNKEYLV